MIFERLSNGKLYDNSRHISFEELCITLCSWNFHINQPLQDYCSKFERFGKHVSIICTPNSI